ncbi:hypothetical protein [Legionella sainthelensi]|uniref:Coiled-coil protein n=1 Tax=Legionella sainthelensi TaxID=28087 RepID=A0A2H5FQ94_9GAMM|nr:hypothetical protein [Legionella sainthelensi]AUH73735.1 hypothetical protein CAB17_18055 [Legionella sainthelensi]
MPIEIYTWKSGSKGVGFSKPVKSILLGGNVGHAAIELTFPADAKGNELAKKYQDVPGLSISKRTEIVPEKKADGNYAPKEQVSYFVYFSWWPGHTNGHHINSHRDDLEAEWRHEPSQKIKPHAHDHIFGDEVPEKNKTNVTGAFIREKTITKIKEISHTVLQKNIGDDPAYKELKAEETALKNELEQLKNKLEIYKDEVLNARRENREPNKDLDLNEAENVRYHEINKDIRRIDAQIKLCQIDFEERHLSVGERPSSVIRISTSNDHNAPAFALDAENVLDKMASLAQSNSAYSFYKFNCSTTATEVLKAGISNELKSTMKADGFNVENASKATISTPTSFSNFGRQLQTELIHLNTKNSTLELDTTAAAATTVTRISEISTLTTPSFKERFQHAVKERDKTIDIDEDYNSNLSFSMD